MCKMLILSSTISKNINTSTRHYPLLLNVLNYFSVSKSHTLSDTLVFNIGPNLKFTDRLARKRKKNLKIKKLTKVNIAKVKKKKIKKYKRRTAFKYLIRPLILLLGQTVLFTLSLKKRNISFKYNRFLKTNSIKNVSKVMHWCLVTKEPSFFLIPYSNMLTDLDMFSHRRLLRLAQSSLYWFVLHNFGILLGFYFSCSGKISVGGNSRTRTMLKSYGYKSSSLFTTQTTNTSAIINTITGCLGLLLIFFY